MSGEKRLPTTRERNALQRLSGCEDRSKLRAGKKTVDALFENGWIEYCPDTMPGFPTIRLTSLGKKARYMEVPKEKRKKTRLSMLQPTVHILDPRIAHPSPRKRKQ